MPHFFKRKGSVADIQERFDGRTKRYWYGFNGLEFRFGKDFVELEGTGDNFGFGVDTKKGTNGAPFILGKNNCIEFDISGTAPAEVKLELTDFADNVELLIFNVNNATPHQKLLLNRVRDKISKIQFIFGEGEVNVRLANLGFCRSERTVSRIFIPTLAFDIGHSSIKMALVDNQQHPLLLDHQEIPHIENDDNRLTEVIRLIRAMIFKHKLKVKQLTFVISDPAISHRRVLLNNVEKKEEWTQFFQKELTNSIPFPSENNIITYFKNDQEDKDFFVSIAPSAILKNYRDLLKRLGLTSRFAMESTMALYNIFRNFFPSSAPTTALIEIGASKTTIAILNSNKILFSRYIKLGGNAFTEHLASTLNIPREKAEKLKRSYQTLGNKEKAALQEVANNWLTDISRTLEYYTNDNPQDPVQQIFLCGGGSLLPGLPEQLKERTGITASTCLVLSTLNSNLAKTLVENKTQTCLFSSVLGLALEKAEDRSARNIFRGQPVSKKDASSKKTLAGAAKGSKKSFYDWKFFKLEKKLQYMIVGSIFALFLFVIPAFFWLSTGHLQSKIAQQQESSELTENKASSANALVQEIRQANTMLNRVQNEKKYKPLLSFFNSLLAKNKTTLLSLDYNSQNDEFTIQGSSTDQWNVSQLVSRLQSNKLLMAPKLVYTQKQNNTIMFKVQGKLKGNI